MELDSKVPSTKVVKWKEEDIQVHSWWDTNPSWFSLYLDFIWIWVAIAPEKRNSRILQKYPKKEAC